MEQLIIELNNKKYLLVELIRSEGSKSFIDELIKKHNCIIQSLGEVKKVVYSFHFVTYQIVRVLVPEENVLSFNNERINNPL